MRNSGFYVVLFFVSLSWAGGIPTGVIQALPLGGKLTLIMTGPAASQIYKSMSKIPETSIQNGLELRRGKKGDGIVCFIENTQYHICYVTVTPTGIQ